MKTKQKIIEIFDTEKEGMFRYASYRLQDMKDVEDVEDAMHNLYVKLLSKPELVAGVAQPSGLCLPCLVQRMHIFG